MHILPLHQAATSSALPVNVARCMRVMIDELTTQHIPLIDEDTDKVTWLADSLRSTAQANGWHHAQWQAARSHLLYMVAPGHPWQSEPFAYAALRACKEALRHA